MTKKIIIVFISLIIVMVLGAVAFNYLLKKDVRFTLNDTGYTVAIYKDDKKVDTLGESSTVRLSKGSYTYTVTGDNYKSTTEDFMVDTDKEVTVTPQYLDEYKAAQLQKEEPSIRAALTNKFPALFSNFHIYEINLYEKSTWAAGILAETVDRRSNPDYYRFVLQKQNDTWNVIVEPQIVISSAKYPEVPKDIINSLYTESTKYKSY